MAEVQWQLEMFQGLAQELEKELIETKAELFQVKNDNQTLQTEKAEIEEKLWAKKIEILDIKKANASSEGYFSPLKRLQAMKDAFEENERVLLNNQMKLENRNILIDKYEEYCRGLRTILKNWDSKKKSSDHQRVSDMKDYCVLIECQRDSAIRENVNIKIMMEKFKKELSLLKNDNGILRNTVTALSFYIEELLVQHEPLISKFPHNSQTFESSSAGTSTHSETTSILEGEKHQKVTSEYNQGSGDKIEETVVAYSQDIALEKEKEIGDSDIWEFQSNSNLSEKLFIDLSHMAKSVESLGRSTQEIISVSLGHTQRTSSNYNSYE